MADKDLSVNQRIKSLIEYYSSLTQRGFADKIGVSQSAVSSLFSSRENRPGLEMLQKIAIAYPELSLDWLLIGRGPMFRSEAIQAVRPELTQFQVQGNTVQEQVTSYLQSEEVKSQIEAMIDKSVAKHEKRIAATSAWYVVAKSYPYGPESQLSVRLGVTEEEARQLILNGKIQASDLGKLGFRVSEQAVQDFLARH